MAGPLAPVSRGLLATQPDSTLCALARRGHNGAYAALYARYQPAISRFVSQLLGHGRAEDAADVTQEVFAAAFSAMTARDREVPFKPWLYKIARNRSIDYLRAKRPITADLDGDTLPSAETPATQFEQREELRLVVTAIESLPTRQREALVLRELGGLSHDEIATTLETTVPSVKQLLTRGRASVNKRANLEGARGGRQLRKSLAAIYPPIPIAGGWNSLAGTLGLVGASAGTASKVAAIALIIGAIGGGAAGVQQASSGNDRNGDKSATLGDTAPNSSGTDSVTTVTGDRQTAKDKKRAANVNRERTAMTDGATNSGDSSNSAGGGDQTGSRDDSGNSPSGIGGTPVATPDIGSTLDQTTVGAGETVGGISPTLGDTISGTLDSIPNVGGTVDNAAGTVDEVVKSLPVPELPKLPAPGL